MNIAQFKISKEDVLFCRDTVAKYLAQAKAYEAKAETCEPRQRGAYRSNATQKRKSAQHMQANHDALMGELVQSNFPLYLELKETEGEK